MSDNETRATCNYQSKTVCVTGATGGIGARLVERLALEHGARVRVLVRNMTRAPRLARLPVEFVCGDVRRPQDVAEAARDCDVVMHCAYANTADPALHAQTNVAGTEAVLRACRQHRARLVHVSTCRVFGMKTPDGDLDEHAPYQSSGQAYADSKLEAEKLVFDWHRRYDIPVAVIQPTTVYGPFIQVWTLAYMKMLSRFRPILVEGGSGLCNAVYVDDVVEAMLLAGTCPDAIGENFLISAREPVTWHDFHSAFAAMLGAPPGVAMSRAEALEFYRKAGAGKPRSVLRELPALWREEKVLRRRIATTAEYAALRRLKQRVVRRRSSGSSTPRGAVRPHPAHQAEPVPSLPIRALSPSEIEFFAARTRFRIDKAQRLLGYTPRFDFAQGMAMVERWAQWANLTPAADAFLQVPLPARRPGAATVQPVST